MLLTSIQGLGGKIICSRRIGAGTEYALRRLLLKLGLTLGKDVMLLPTGISESDRRLLMIMQGKIDAQLGTEDNLMPLAARGRKFNVLPREETNQNDIEALSSVILISRAGGPGSTSIFH